MTTRDTDPPTLTVGERSALRKLGVLKVEWSTFGSHFVLGNENLRLSDIRRAVAAIRKLLGPMLNGREPGKIDVEFKATEGVPFDMKVQLPGGGSHHDLTFDDDVRALLTEYLQPKYSGASNVSVEVVLDGGTGAFKGLMAHVLVVRGEPQTLDEATMLAVPGVKKVTIQPKATGCGVIILARLDTRNPDDAQAIARALSDAIGLEIIGDVTVSDPRPEKGLFDED